MHVTLSAIKHWSWAQLIDAFIHAFPRELLAEIEEDTDGNVPVFWQQVMVHVVSNMANDPANVWLRESLSPNQIIVDNVDDHGRTCSFSAEEEEATTTGTTTTKSCDGGSARPSMPLELSLTAAPRARFDSTVAKIKTTLAAQLEAQLRTADRRLTLDLAFAELQTPPRLPPPPPSTAGATESTVEGATTEETIATAAASAVDFSHDGDARAKRFNMVESAVLQSLGKLWQLVDDATAHAIDAFTPEVIEQEERAGGTILPDTLVYVAAQPGFRLDASTCNDNKKKKKKKKELCLSRRPGEQFD